MWSCVPVCVCVYLPHVSHYMQLFIFLFTWSFLCRMPPVIMQLYSSVLCKQPGKKPSPSDLSPSHSHQSWLMGIYFLAFSPPDCKCCIVFNQKMVSEKVCFQSGITLPRLPLQKIAFQWSKPTHWWLDQIWNPPHSSKMSGKGWQVSMLNQTDLGRILNSCIHLAKLT